MIVFHWKTFLQPLTGFILVKLKFFVSSCSTHRRVTDDVDSMLWGRRICKRYFILLLSFKMRWFKEANIYIAEHQTHIGKKRIAMSWFFFMVIMASGTARHARTYNGSGGGVAKMVAILQPIGWQRLAATDFSNHYKRSSLILDIPFMVRWHISKQGI